MDVHTGVFPQVRALQLCAGIRCGPIPWLYVGCIEPAESEADRDPCSVGPRGRSSPTGACVAWPPPVSGSRAASSCRQAAHRGRRPDPASCDPPQATPWARGLEFGSADHRLGRARRVRALPRALDPTEVDRCASGHLSSDGGRRPRCSVCAWPCSLLHLFLVSPREAQAEAAVRSF